MPPAWQRSGWTTVAACFSSTSRNPHLVQSRSPVAIGMEVERATVTITSTFSGRHGSSMNIGWYGSRAFASRTARAGLIWPWKSIAMSISGPTASRMAANRSTTSATHAGLSMIRAGHRPGPVFSAV